MKQKNYAFIDGQNLYQGLSWDLDYKRFRIYLKDKYKIEKAYYFLGFKEKENALYESLQEAGFILIFNEKPEHLKSEKKGNVDVNLVFYVMRKFAEQLQGEEKFDKIVLVSGDGDFKVLVDYFIGLDKFFKVVAPNSKYASSLYRHKRHLDPKYFSFLDNKGIRKKIEYFKKKQKKAP